MNTVITKPLNGKELVDAVAESKNSNHFKQQS